MSVGRGKRGTSSTSPTPPPVVIAPGHPAAWRGMLVGMPVLRLTIDDLVVDALTDADDLDAIFARLIRSVRRDQVSVHRTSTGGWLLINWRSVGVVQLELVYDQPTLHPQWAACRLQLVPDGQAPAEPAAAAGRPARRAA